MIEFSLTSDLFADLRVVKAYPCKCRIADKDDGLLIESQVHLKPFLW